MLASHYNHQRAENDDRLKAHLLDSVGQAVMATNLDGEIIYWNAFAERLYGWERAEVLGKNILEVTPADSSLEQAREIMELLVNGGSWSGEFTVRRKDGSSFIAHVTDTPLHDENGELAGIIGVSYDITESKQSQEELRRREHELEAIAQVSSALKNVTTRSAMLPIILAQVKALIHAGGVALATRDPNTEEILIEAAIGEWAPAVGERRAPGEGLTGQVIDSRLPYRNPDIRSETSITRLEVTANLRSVAGVPLIGHELILGALWVGRKHAVSDEEMRILSAIGDIAASALYRASLFEETQREAERMAAINASGRALAETLDLLDIYRRLAYAVLDLLPDISTILITLFDPVQKLITCAYGIDEGEPVDISDLPPIALMPPGEGTQSEVIHTRQPLIVRDIHAKIKAVNLKGSDERLTQSAMYVPMLARDQVLGVMQVQSYTLNRFRERDAELLGLVGNTAAIAIQNARLLAETRQRLHHITALRAIDQAITSSMDVRVTLKILLDQVIGLMHVSAASVLLVNRHDNTLEYAAGRGFRTNAIMRTRLRLGEGLAGAAALERRIVHQSDLPGIGTDFSRAALLADEAFVSYSGVPLVSKGRVVGVLEIFQREKLDLDQGWLDFLEALAGQAAIAIENASLFESLQRSNLELSLAYDATIEGWSRAMDLRDKETEGHTRRVAEITLQLARAMGFSEAELVHIRRGALLHDIGKMGVPDSVLLKPGPLSDDEWGVMRRHPVQAYEMLSPIPFLRPALDIPYYHHERWDGSGYPRGLKGEQIPLAARLFALVDVWDALLSERPYRPPWPVGKVLEYIRENSGILFDPRVVEVFLRTVANDPGVAET